MSDIAKILTGGATGALTGFVFGVSLKPEPERLELALFNNRLYNAVFYSVAGGVLGCTLTMSFTNSEISNLDSATFAQYELVLRNYLF